jgi:16S rRNA (uracil1498-N3)-methyltransferase
LPSGPNVETDCPPLAAAQTFFPVPVDVLSAPLPVHLPVSDRETVHYWKNVRRLSKGDRLTVVDEATGAAFLARLETLDRHSATLLLESRLPEPAGPSLPEVTLAVALIKEQRWDWLLQKVAELGASRIVPLLTERTVVQVHDDAKKQARWASILRQAAEQSEGRFIPEIHPPTSLTAFCKKPPEGLKLHLLERGPHRAPLSAPLSEAAASDCPRLSLVIGPEGGWTESECALLETSGFQAVSLGSRILRTETAAIAAMLGVVYAWDR